MPTTLEHLHHLLRWIQRPEVKSKIPKNLYIVLERHVRAAIQEETP